MPSIIFFEIWKMMYIGVVHFFFFYLFMKYWILHFYLASVQYYLYPIFSCFLLFLKSCAFAESFSREPLVSTMWDDLWYHTFPKDSLQEKFQTIKFDNCLWCRVLATFKFHWFITVQSVKFDALKLSIRLFDPQICTHLMLWYSLATVSPSPMSKCAIEIVHVKL